MREHARDGTGKEWNNSSPLNQPGAFKIGIIGSYPPPYGGVTVHVQRLMRTLDERHIEYVLYDILGEHRENRDPRIVCIHHPKLWMLKYFFSGNTEIVHNQTTDWRGQVIVGLMGLLGKKTISTLHSEKLLRSWKTYNILQRKVLQIALQSTTALIVVNADIRDFCISIGVDPEKIFLIPAFIPPVLMEDEMNEIPRDIWDFLDTHDPVISANAFAIKFFNGEDVYGIDLCIEVCNTLKHRWNTIGLVFFLPQTGDVDYFNRLKQRLADYQLQDNFLFVTRPYPFYPLLLKSTVFVRPTNTDGDALSLREALFFGIPSVASNVVTRPEGTILFKNRDIHDFTAKVQDVLENYSYYRQRLNSSPPDDYSAGIVRVYQKVAGISDVPRTD